MLPRSGSWTRCGVTRDMLCLASSGFPQRTPPDLLLDHMAVSPYHPIKIIIVLGRDSFIVVAGWLPLIASLYYLSLRLFTYCEKGTWYTITWIEMRCFTISTCCKCPAVFLRIGKVLWDEICGGRVGGKYC